MAEGKIKAEPIKFVGKLSDGYNTTYSVEDDGTISFMYSPESEGFSDNNIFIYTKGESYTVFNVSVSGHFNRKRSTSINMDAVDLQIKLFRVCSDIILWKANERGISKKEIAYAKSKIDKCIKELKLHSYHIIAACSWCSAYLDFSAKDGISCEWLCPPY